MGARIDPERDEREILKGWIEFSFLVKAQLASAETTMLRALLNIAIMEAEEALEALDTQDMQNNDHPRCAGDTSRQTS